MKYCSQRILSFVDKVFFFILGKIWDEMDSILLAQDLDMIEIV